MEKKFQVFISSTFEDLKEERQKICDAVLTLYQIPIGMEMFSAADEEQWEIIKSHIDDTDFYVLVIGNRYGSVITEGPDKGISYTEKEYNYAVANGVPVLAFLIDENVPVKPCYVEKKYPKKLAAFKEKVCQGREVVWWKTQDELVTKVSQSLAKQILRNKRPGWIRSDSPMADKTFSTGPSITDDSVLIEDRTSEAEIKQSKSDSNAPKVTIGDKELELYSIYLDDICPQIVRLEVNDIEFPIVVFNEIRAAFTHMARYKVKGDELELKNAVRHITRCQLDLRKCSCVSDAEFFQTFMKNQKRVMWNKKLVPDDIVRQEALAREYYIQAKQAEISGLLDIDELLHLYDEACSNYLEVRVMIDRYIKSL